MMILKKIYERYRLDRIRSECSDKSEIRNQKSKIFITAILVVALISSCKVGKEYKRPDLELPQQFHNVSFADTSSIADIEWKKFFTDPDLQNLISKGLTYNHDLL